MYFVVEGSKPSSGGKEMVGSIRVPVIEMSVLELEVEKDQRLVYAEVVRVVLGESKDVRKTLKSFPKFLLMLPYLTVNSVVGVMSGETSDMTPELWKAAVTSAVRSIDIPAEDGYVACFIFNQR